MKKILRSTFIAAASFASMFSLPHGKEENGRQKKQRAQTHPKRAPKTVSPAGLAASGGRDGDVPNKAAAESAAARVSNAVGAATRERIMAALRQESDACAAEQEIPPRVILPKREAESATPVMPRTLTAEKSRPEEPTVPPVAEQSAPARASAEQQVPAADRYPWKRDIVTTTFWIGEKPSKNNPTPNRTSSWDKDWAAHFGGTDTPVREDRRDFRPAAFVPGQNPFYVALPYNDLQESGHKPEARKVVPWFHDEYRASNQSVCKGRWVAIRLKGKTVYAQWEDCGPFRTDHSGYVFGDERPKKNINKGAGLDVSPAVRDCLGMDDTDVTDWKFVEFEEVPEGPWSKYGENNTFVIARRLNELRIAALANDRRGHE